MTTSLAAPESVHTQAPAANAAPLGLAGFGVTTIVFSCVSLGPLYGSTREFCTRCEEPYSGPRRAARAKKRLANQPRALTLTTAMGGISRAEPLAGFVPETASSAVVPLAFSYGGVGQIMTGVLEFRKGNTFGTIAYTSFGLFWWWYALLQRSVGAGWLTAPAPEGVGIALLAWGLLAFGLWAATFRTTFVVWSIFLLLWLAFFLLGAANFGMATGRLGGWVALLLGLEALYLALADVMKVMYGRDVLPVGGPILKG